MAWEYLQTCGGTLLCPYRLHFSRTVERVTAQGSAPWVRGMRLPYAPAPSNRNHQVAEPTIPNLLLLDVGEIGATGLQQFWNQKKPLRDNWWRGKPVEQQARQLLFWNFFLFGKEKSGTSSPCQRKKILSKVLSAYRKNSQKTLFIYQIYRVGKILYFSHSIRRHFSAALRRFFIISQKCENYNGFYRWKKKWKSLK